MSCQLLHRIDPKLNMARFYRVEVSLDLFGQVIVERRWGPIGGRGQYPLASYPSTSSAEQVPSQTRSQDAPGRTFWIACGSKQTRQFPPGASARTEG